MPASSGSVRVSAALPRAVLRASAAAIDDGDEMLFKRSIEVNGSPYRLALARLENLFRYGRGGSAGSWLRGVEESNG